MQKIQGWVEKGATLVSTGGLVSTTKVQGSFPLATVTVYVTGTVTLAPIYSDNAATPTPLANPFTASSTGTFGFFAPNGAYDIVLSGGGLSAPFTLASVRAFDETIVEVDVTAAPFFADATGTADTYVALQAAIDYCISIGGGIVLFPKGLYKISLRLKIDGDNVWIKGVGQGATIIRQTTNVTTGGGETVGDGFHVYGDNIKISDLTLRGAAGTNPPQVSGGSKAVIFEAGHANVLFEDLIVDQWAYRAFQIGGAQENIRIHKVLMQDLGDEGVLVSPGGSDVAEVEVSNCELTRWRSWGLDTNSSKSRFINNYLHDSNVSSSPSDAGGITFSGNLASGLAAGNLIVNLAAAIGCINITAGDGGSVSDIVISNNEIISDAAIINGMYFETIGSGVLKQITVSNNTFRNARFYTKKISYLILSGNNSICTLTTSGTDAGYRIDSTATASEIRHILTGNQSYNWDEGLRTGAAASIITTNILVGLVSDLIYDNQPPIVVANNILGGVSAAGVQELTNSANAGLNVGGAPKSGVNMRGIRSNATMEPSVDFGDATSVLADGTLVKTHTGLGYYGFFANNPSVSGAGAVALSAAFAMGNFNRGTLNYGLYQPSGTSVIHYIAGMLKTDRYIEIKNDGGPASASTSVVKLYADTSGGKTRLMALFPTGVAQQIAIEP